MSKPDVNTEKSKSDTTREHEANLAAALKELAEIKKETSNI